jgi:hypothetical protein
MRRSLLFESPEINETVDVVSMDPKDPKHTILRVFGDLFLSTMTQRVFAPWEEGACSSLAEYEKCAPGRPIFAGTVADVFQRHTAKTIKDAISRLAELIAKEGEEGPKYGRLGEALAVIFGTYHAGLRACDNNHVSPGGQELVAYLKSRSPFPFWLEKFEEAEKNFTNGDTSTVRTSRSESASSGITTKRGITGSGTTVATGDASMSPSENVKHNPATASVGSSVTAVASSQWDLTTNAGFMAALEEEMRRMINGDLEHSIAPESARPTDTSRN